MIQNLSFSEEVTPLRSSVVPEFINSQVVPLSEDVIIEELVIP